MPSLRTIPGLNLVKIVFTNVVTNKLFLKFVVVCQKAFFKHVLAVKRSRK